MTSKFQSILLGSVIVGLVATLFGLAQVETQSQVLGTLACCVIPTIGALIATWHYASTNGLTMSPGSGAMMGLSVGVLGYLISLILNIIVSYTGLMPSPFDVDAIMELSRESMVNQGMSDEEIDRGIDMARQYYPAFVAAAAVVYALIGAVVGAIGANVFKHGAVAEEAAE